MGMLGIILIIGLMVLCGLAGRWLFLFIFDSIVPRDSFKEEPPNTFIDKSTHYHQHLTISDGDITTTHSKQASIDD